MACSNGIGANPSSKGIQRHHNRATSACFAECRAAFFQSDLPPLGVAVALAMGSVLEEAEDEEDPGGERRRREMKMLIRQVNKTQRIVDDGAK